MAKPTIIVILSMLMAIMMSVGVFATLDIDAKAYWYTPTRDGHATASQDTAFSTFWATSGGNVVNITTGTIPVTNAQFSNGILIDDITGDGYQEYIVASNTTVYVMGMLNSNPYIVSSFTTGGRIIAPPRIVQSPAGGLVTKDIIAVLVMTNEASGYAQVEFLEYRPSTGLRHAYVIDSNDAIFPLTSQIRFPSDMVCKPASSSDASQIALCAITGKNPSTSYGEILLFAPGYVYAPVGGYYVPPSYQLNLSNGVNTFSPILNSTPTGQTPSIVHFEVKQPSQIALTHDANLPYPYTDALYFGNTDMTTMYRVLIEADSLALLGTNITTYDASWNGTSGVSVPLQTLGSSNSQVQNRRLFLFDVNGSGQKQVCVERMRNANLGNGGGYIDIQCLDNAHTMYAGNLSWTFSNTNVWYMSFGYPTTYDDWVDTSIDKPLFCQHIEAQPFYGTGSTLSDGAYIICGGLQGTSLQMNFTRTYPYVATGGDINQMNDAQYKQLSRFNAYTEYEHAVGALEFYDGNSTFSSPSYQPTVSSFVTTATQTSNCISGNFAYGTDLELACVNNGNVVTVTNTMPVNYTVTSQNYTQPTLIGGGVLTGYPSSPCFGQTIQLKAVKCTTANTPNCAFTNPSSDNVRLITDSGTGDMVYGSYSTTDPVVYITMPNTSTILEINTWVQSISSHGDYTQATVQTVSVKPSACGTIDVTDPNMNESTTTNTTTTTPSSGITSDNVASDFFSGLFNHDGSSPIKIFMGLLCVLGLTIYVATLPAVAKMNNPMPVLLIASVLGAIGVTFIGLLSSWVLIITILFEILTFVLFAVVLKPTVN